MNVRTILLVSLVAATVAATGTLPVATRASDDAPAAVLVSVGGPVTVTRTDGTITEAIFGMQLSVGDHVSTGAEGSAEIMLQGSNWLQLGPNSSITIMKPHVAAEAPAAEKHFEVVQNFIKLKSSEGTSTLTGLRGGTEENDALVALSPCQTKVRDARPTFHWQIEDPSIELRLVVSGTPGVVWQTDVTGSTEATYGADATALETGVKYSWKLESTDPLLFPALATTAAFFEIMADADVTSLEKALAALEGQERPGDSAYHVVRASIYFDHGLVEDAIAETRNAVALDPDNDSLRAILAQLYRKSGRTDLALSEYDKLLGDR